MPAALSSLSVLMPAAMWALLALGIPLLIHIFSRSRGRLVKIGHIDLVRKARQIQVTELKLTQWLLLFLRLAIFTVVALILTGLATAGLNSSTSPAIYLTPAWVKTSEPAEIEALMRSAEQEPPSRVFMLQAGFPPPDPQLLQTHTQSSPVDIESLGNVWSLLSERLSLEQHDGVVSVYATDYALQFGSRAPALPRDVDWQISHPQWAPVQDKHPLKVLIAYDRDRSDDAALFAEVLMILKENRQPDLVWEMVDLSRFETAPFKPDWLVYLSADKTDADIIDKFESPAVLLRDSSGALPEEVNQYLNLPFYPFTNFRVDKVGSLKSINSGSGTDTGGHVLLASLDGVPLLQQYHQGQTRILRLGSRFSSRWSSLTQQAEFPELLLQLMMDSKQEMLRFSNARIDPGNLKSHRSINTSDNPVPRRSLQGLLAVLLALLWIGERWLSERSPRE
jgi:hypothetical protein